MERGRKRVLIECKLSKAPKPSRGFHRLIAEMNPDAAWLAAPVDTPYEIHKNLRVGNLQHIKF